MAWAEAASARLRPGSPWMPTPTSMWNASRSIVGLPAMGVVHEVSATPMLRLQLVHRAAEAGHLRERPALLGRGAADLLGQHRGAHAAASGGVEAVLDGHVVGDHDLLDHEPLVAGKVGGHLEVHDVAGVVLHDVQHAGAAVDGLRRRQHLVGGRRGEDFARAGGVEHARADEPPVQRLVTGPAAGDDRHLARHGRVGARDPVRAGVDDETAGVRERHADELLPDDVPGTVDQFLHRAPLQLRPPARSGGVMVLATIVRRARAAVKARGELRPARTAGLTPSRAPRRGASPPRARPRSAP